MADGQITFRAADRLLNTPPYPFLELGRLKREAIAKGVDLIDFGIGDPDIPTADVVIKTMQEAVTDATTHQYDETGIGTAEYRQAIVDWFKRRFDVTLNPETEVLRLIGSKDGISHAPLAFLNPGDLALIPDPGYPVYKIAVMFAGAESYFMPLTAANGYVPDLDAIPAEVAAKAKLMFVCYPNNPTAAVVDKDFLVKLVDFARRNEILLCQDMAYSEVTFDGYRCHSLMEIDGAKDVAIEFHSLSKMYNMTGWRLAFAVGNPSALAILAKFKGYMDSGAFMAIQRAGAAALNSPDEVVQQTMAIYQRRRDLLVDGLNSLGWQVEKPKATFYIWAPVPSGYTSASFAEVLLSKAGILVTPGSAYGQYGEGYVRFSLTVQGGNAEARIKEAITRLRENIKIEW
jgi:LL-diaminopimelate aminotransferase